MARASRLRVRSASVARRRLPSSRYLYRQSREIVGVIARADKVVHRAHYRVGEFVGVCSSPVGIELDPHRYQGSQRIALRGLQTTDADEVLNELPGKGVRSCHSRRIMARHGHPVSHRRVSPGTQGLPSAAEAVPGSRPGSPRRHRGPHRPRRRFGGVRARHPQAGRRAGQ